MAHAAALLLLRHIGFDEGIRFKAVDKEAIFISLPFFILQQKDRKSSCGCYSTVRTLSGHPPEQDGWLLLGTWLTMRWRLPLAATSALDGFYRTRISKLQPCCSNGSSA
jgi:hypothetical protein